MWIANEKDNMLNSKKRVITLEEHSVIFLQLYSSELKFMQPWDQHENVSIINSHSDFNKSKETILIEKKKLEQTSLNNEDVIKHI
jgi:hypothetical protein